MAVEASRTLDVQSSARRLRRLRRAHQRQPVAYLDSASSTQKPRQVLDAMREFYEHSYANVHRGVYTLAERATAGFEGAREKVRALINAPSNREVIFTRSATEALNLVAYAWGLENLGPGDVVVITELEHHANFVPWQFIAKRTGARVRAHPDRRPRRAAARHARRARGARQHQGRREQPRLEHARDDQPGREARRLGARAGRDHGRRRGAGRPAPARSTCRRSAATSSPSRRTSSAARAASARSGAGASCSRRCSPSTSAAR